MSKAYNESYAEQIDVTGGDHLLGTAKSMIAMEHLSKNVL